MSQLRPFVPDDKLFPGLLRRLEERACLPGQLLEQLVLGLPRTVTAPLRLPKWASTSLIACRA